MSNEVPSTTQPLVITPNQPKVPQTIIDGLGQLSRLIGTWNSIPAGTYSWNVMPLPQDNVEDDFILKNFAYTEELSFATIPGTAPNRGGGFTQVANTIFYEQRVYFSPGSTVPSGADYTLVHAENGSWLFLDIINQFPDAFPPAGTAPVPLPDGTTELPTQPADKTIVKQMSVPHGNSILAQGTVFPAAEFETVEPVVAPGPRTAKPLTVNPGLPHIPAVNTIPEYQGVPYGADKYGPSTTNADGIESNSNINPNIKLVEYLATLNIDDVVGYVAYHVSSENTDITNISFESKHAEVVYYDMDVWIIDFKDGSSKLLYSQEIDMNLTLSDATSAGTKTIKFPHITCNVLDFVTDAGEK